MSEKTLSLHVHPGTYASEHSIKCQDEDFAKWTLKLYLIYMYDIYIYTMAIQKVTYVLELKKPK